MGCKSLIFKELFTAFLAFCDEGRFILRAFAHDLSLHIIDALAQELFELVLGVDFLGQHGLHRPLKPSFVF